MAFVFLASPGLSVRHEVSSITHRSRLNNSYSFDDCTEDSFFKGNIYGSSSCESYNEYFSSTSEFEPPVNFYISEDDEGFNDRPKKRSSKVNKKLTPAYQPTNDQIYLPSSGPTFLSPPVLKWSDYTYNNNPQYLETREFPSTYHSNMSRGGNSPFSIFCNTEDMLEFPEDEEYKFPPAAELLRLQDTKKAKVIKSMIRSSNWSIGHSIRKKLWRTSLELQDSTIELLTEEDYWKRVDDIFGSRDVDYLDANPLPAAQIEHTFNEYLFQNYYLNEKGKQACSRIVPAFLEMRTSVKCCPMIYAITALLLHYMEEVEAFHCLDRMYCSKNNYLTLSQHSKEGICNGLDILSRRHQKNAYNKMSKLSMPDKDHIFFDWDKWIFTYLPFHILIRVMDCYLYEGIKILYRTCMACFTLCMKEVMENPTTSSALNSDGFARAMELFLPNIKKTPKQFLNNCFKIRKLSTKEIGKAMSLPIDHGKDSDDTDSPRVSDEFEEEDIFTPEVQAELARFTHTATLQEMMQIWKRLPMRMQLSSPNVVFTTEEHGCSLNTLYRLTEKFEPFLVIIKDYDDHVFGAYCSHSLLHRNEKDEYDQNKTFFGNGETFVFTVQPEFRQYPWVGIKMQSQDATRSHVDRDCQLFIHADSDQIMIGGGLNTSAIQFDKDLRIGKSSDCKTFNSPMLSKKSDFSIKVLEIYSFSQK